MAFNRRIFSPQIWSWPAECWRSTIRLSVIDALDWYVTNYDAIRRQFNSGKIATLFTSHRGDSP